MVAWTVWKYEREGGRCPLDEWIASNAVTKKDKASLDSRIDKILGINGQLPPEFLKQYHGTRLHELKVRAMKKQLRPLCVVLPERRIIILCGAIEKDGKISPGDLERAENLRSALENGSGNLVIYYQTARPMEPVSRPGIP